MPTKAEIVNQIEEQIIPNLMELITGGILQNVLLGMVDQINTLVGELDDLNTDDTSSIVNAINELVNNIQAIEDNLTPYVYFGIDDPNIVTPVGFGGDIPSFYVQQQHSGLDVVNIGFWTYTGIIGKEWVDLSLEDVGGASFITTTKANLDTLISNEELIPNALYEITGVQPSLYGGTTIYLQAISTTELNPNGVGKFYNPKYDQTEQGFGIAVDYVYWAGVGDQKTSGVYGVNDVVIWGGKHWTCIQPTTTSTKYIIDVFNLDTDYFVEIPFNETDYNVAYDAIKYDYENDWIIERNEKNSNIVSFTYEWLKYFECDFSWIGNCNNDPNDLIQVDPIKNFQWGNTYSFENYVGIGIGFQKITNSVNQNINFRGSHQYNLTFDNNSRQYNLIFNNDSYQHNLTFDNSYQSNLTFDNSSYQDNLIFDNNSYQYNLTFDNNGYQNYLTFDNNSNQRNLTSSGSNRRQRYLTFNSFQVDRTGQPLNSNEDNLTFDNTIQNLPQYGQGNITGTPTYILGVTADGKVVETENNETIRMVLTPDGEDAETGDKVGFYVDGDWDIISAHATAQTAPTGSSITINIKKNGSSITSTPITIPNGSNTSLASSGAVFSSTSVTTGDLLVPSIASVGSTIKGQNLQLIFKYIRK